MNPRRKYRKLLFAVVVGLLAALMARAADDACDAAPLPSGSYQVSSPFGPRIYPLSRAREWRMHAGLDLACKTGTPVSAVGDGVVLFASRSQSCYGNVIFIAHSGSVVTVYAHLSRIAPGLRRGVWVRAGDVIALSGATGCVTGPHLHFEVWKAGQRVNPLLVCAALQRQRKGAAL